ncbi:protein required for attachment to host cells [Sinobaca qinghaiensis]|uniref:Protein required for attachment to host cells n=1 Tax=Sinobaca qinghaiensis TaxID=342944 RepID=A0A419UZH0_9BACL|nr:VLRF1 family aeRF1-type release factor [Sinobaca qinghaiensis]RKD71069.1 protein required for attachment to host cells [Sinobaca qinghaiensis]
MSEVENIKKLSNVQDENGILSIYLNTDFTEGSQQGGEWKIRLKNGLKKLKEYAEASESKEQLKTYKKTAEKADQRIHDLQADMQKGLVLIVDSKGSILLEKILQVPIETDFQWEKHPVVDQLDFLQKDYPAAGILLVQQRDVILLDTALGEIRDQRKFSWELESEDWKQYQGTAARAKTASGSTHVDELQQRFEENQQRWYKKLAPTLDKEVKKRGLEGVYLVGSKEYVRDLEQHLGAKIIDTIPKNLISKPAHEIVNEVYGEIVR